MSGLRITITIWGKEYVFYVPYQTIAEIVTILVLLAIVFWVAIITA